MEELLEKLEDRIKIMLDRLEYLQQGQQALREKHDSAIMQVERMISRLKSLEEKS